LWIILPIRSCRRVSRKPTSYFRSQAIGCADVEDAATTDKEAEPKVEATDKTDINGVKEEAAPEAVDEPEVEEAVAEDISPDTNDEGFPGFDLLEVDGGDLSGYR
jgi:hypothetical protein